MAEYIDRDDAIRKALGACVKVVGRGITQIESADVIDIMESIPTVDVVEVVRCKDCKYYVSEDFHCSHNYAFYHTVHSYYCSFGERKCNNG